MWKPGKVGYKPEGNFWVPEMLFIFMGGDMSAHRTLKTVHFSRSFTQLKKNYFGGFPGGAVVKNPPANAGDMVSNPGLGRSHMPPATKPVRHNY